MSVEIFTVIKNAEYILPLYLKHYQANFPGCVINIYDNGSTDQSIKLCKDAGCVVHSFPLYTEELLQNFKNTVWKKSKAEWVIVCDVDELLQIDSADVLSLPQKVSVIQFKGYNMIDINESRDPELFTHGYHCQSYDKCCMFKRSIISINFSHGAHFADPFPTPIYSKLHFKLLHYNACWFTFEHFCAKHPRAFRKDLEAVYNISLKDLVKVK